MTSTPPKPRLRPLLTTLAEVAGGLLLAVAAGMVFLPAGVAVLGVVLVAGGYLLEEDPGTPEEQIARLVRRATSAEASP